MSKTIHRLLSGATLVAVLSAPALAVPDINRVINEGTVETGLEAFIPDSPTRPGFETLKSNIDNNITFAGNFLTDAVQLTLEFGTIFASWTSDPCCDSDPGDTETVTFFGNATLPNVNFIFVSPPEIATPEPSGLLPFIAGLAGLITVLRRKRVLHNS
jgi:hypothetical protein